MKVKEYANEANDVTIVWKPELCYHSKNCVNNLPNVFDQAKRPWINANGATSDEIIKVVNMCPSGALSIKDKATTEVSNTKVNIAANGPYLISGSFKVLDPNGTEIEVQGKAALCRCGASATKPFCDGAHSKIGFEG